MADIVHISNKADACFSISIGNEMYTALWDTGAGKSIIAKSCYDKIDKRFKSPLHPSDVYIRAANGSNMNNKGSCHIDFKIGDQYFRHDFLVCEKLTRPIIIGLDFQSRYRIGQDYDEAGNMLLHQGNTLLTYMSRNVSINSIVKSISDVVIPPYCNACLYGALPNKFKKIKKPLTVTFIPSNKHQEADSNICMYDGYFSLGKDSCKQGKIPVTVTNNTGRYVHFKENETLGILSSVMCTDEHVYTLHAVELQSSSEATLSASYKQSAYQSVASADSTTGNPLPHEFVNITKPKLEDACLNPEIANNLQQLLNKYKDSFAEDETNIGSTTLIKMSIDTGDHLPVSKKAYTLSLKNYDWVKNEIDKLLEAGVIQESHSSWSAPVVVVPKADGGKRLCIDYRGLNSVTRKYIWPMPRIEEMFARLGKAKYFTTLDLRAGYHHISLDDESIKKTAFITPFGKYEYKRVPFGLTQAPAYFQELMNKVLKGLHFVMAYLDDIVIYSTSPTEHLKHISIVLDRLKSANLKMKKSKCNFFKKEIHYLGHILSSDGVKPQHHKIQAIKNMNRPTNVRGVREFLGMVGFYRRHINRFSDIAKPLTRLIRKNDKFIWTDECQKSFNALKQALITSPILKYPDPNKAYTIFTDASDIALGSILLQKHNVNGKECDMPIAYLSCQFNETQIKWSTIVKEAYAIYYSVLKWHHYLDGAQITLKTDHRPLQRFLEGKTQNNKLDRWSLEIKGYGIKVEWIKGSENKAADYLSRPPYKELTKTRKESIENNDITCNNVTNIDSNETIVDIVQFQHSDPFCKQLITSINNGSVKPYESAKFHVIDNVLHTTVIDCGKSFTAVVIPKNLRATILHELHDKLGHFGVNKTYSLIKRHYFWPNMSKDIQKYCRTCSLCRRDKLKQDSFAIMNTEIPDRPFDKIAIDLIGDFEKSMSGNVYVLTAMDILTGWPIAIPIPNKQANTVANAILKHIVPEHGCPRFILSDNGREFKNHILDDVCETLGVKRVYTSPHHPQSNGRLENFHNFLKATVRKLSQSDPQSWDEKIPEVIGAYRMCPGLATHESPFFLLYGRDPCLPVHNLVMPQLRYLGDESHKLNLQDMRLAVSTAAKCLKKNRLFKHHKVSSIPDFRVGDLVLYKNHQPSQWDLKWHTGYRVINVINDRCVEIENQSSGRKRKCNISDLKHKLPAENWSPQTQFFGRRAVYVNDPDRLPDIELKPTDVTNHTNNTTKKIAKQNIRKHTYNLRNRNSDI